MFLIILVLKMVFSDFDGTLRCKNSAYDLSVNIGKGKEAKEIYFNIHSKGKDYKRRKKSNKKIRCALSEILTIRL